MSGIWKSWLVSLTIIISCSQLNAQFEERALEVGIDHENSEFQWIGGGVAIFDLNNDDLPDIFLTGGLLVDKLYLNNGNGFDRIINYFDPEDFDYYNYTISAVAVGDVNNDGYDDLFLATFRGYQNILLINNQDNSFDVIDPDSSGIQDTVWSLGASFGDVNKDGLLDIFIHNYRDVDAASFDPITGEVIYEHIGYHNNLYINQGNAVFKESTTDWSIHKNGNSLTSTFSDYDTDGDVDLFVVNDFGAYVLPNELYRNEYPVNDFLDVSVPSGADIALFGMGIAVGDYDGDLDMDYYITNIGKNVLLENDGFGSFSDNTEEAGVGDSSSSFGLTVGWGTGFFDYDNDADLDLYLVNGHINAVPEYDNPESNPNALFRNESNGQFTNVSEAMGFDDPSVFRGSAFGDLNNDGMPDVVKVVTNRGSDPPNPELSRRTAVYYNTTENVNNWIKIKLQGTVSNRNGYGARLYFYDSNGKVQIREADGGSSHASANSSIIHVGLGTAQRVDSLVIDWPSGIHQTVILPTLNELNVVVETEGSVTFSGDLVSSLDLRFYPNPVSDKLFIEWVNFEASLIRLYDYELSSMDGRVLINGSFDGTYVEVSMQHLPSGTYQLCVLHAEEVLITRKLVKIE